MYLFYKRGSSKRLSNITLKNLITVNFKILILFSYLNYGIEDQRFTLKQTLKIYFIIYDKV